MESGWERYFEWMRGEQRRLMTEKGNMACLLSGVLETKIQKKFAVSSGHVYSVNGQMAETSDIVIFDQLHTPKMRAGAAPLIPAETTGVVMQTLDALTDKLLEEEAHHLREVRRLPKLTQKGFTGGLSLATPHPFTLSLIVAGASELSLAEIRDELARIQGDWPTTERVSAVFVLGQGLVIYQTPMTREVRFFPVEDSELTTLKTGEDTLSYLQLYITSYLNSIEIIPPNLMPLLHQSGLGEER